jgi:putative tricarboxylic transport membrane protein
VQQPGESSRALHRLPVWIPSAVLAIMSVAAAAESVQLGLRNASRPGPGFFPFFLSSLLAVAASAIALREASKKETPHVGTYETASSLSVKVFVVLCLYAGLLIPLGFIPATMIFFLLEARMMEGVSLAGAALRGAIATAAAYALFALLGVQLPSGLWFE